MKRKCRFLIVLGLLFCICACTNNEDGSSTNINGSSTNINGTITWKNYDGSILEVDENVPYGAIPAYDGSTPVKEDDLQYSYSFTGWSPSVVAVNGDATYTAQFESLLTKYKINFNLNGGNTSSSADSIYISSLDSTYFFFDVVKDGWSFRGWEYNNERIFDEKGNLLKNIPLINDMIFKAIFKQSTILTITTNLPLAGNQTGEGEYPYNTYVDVYASVNQGYVFVGWYYDGVVLSNQQSYKYMMWSDDITLEARYRVDSFEVMIESNNEDNGLVLLRGNTTQTYEKEMTGYRQYLSSVTIAAYTKQENIRFLGWFDEDNKLVDTNAVYSFVMPNHDYYLEAKWDYFTITYNLDGGINDSDNPNYYNVDNSLVYLQEPTKTGYTFLGWELNGELVSSFYTSLREHIVLTAKWKINEHLIKFLDYDGSVLQESLFEYGSMPVYSGVAPTRESDDFEHRYIFTGWSPSLEVVSSDQSYTANYEYVSAIGTDYSFGEYPQTKVTSSSLITTLNSLAGTLPTSSNSQNWTSYNYYINGSTSNFMWYQDITHTDGNKYRGVYFTSYRPYYTTNSSSTSYSYQDENGYYTSTVYWFRFEPITWIIKDIDLINGKALLMSKTLIDSQQFYRNTSNRTLSSKTVYANNYEHSDIRTFLNDTFYNTSFSIGEKNMILTTTIDNSGASTGNTSNSCACNNTNDKVFIPSYVEAFNSSYFTSNSARQMKASDYAKSQGIYVNSVCSRWWLRSPDSDYSNRARYVNYDGSANDSLVNYCYFGVLPALFIAL